METSLTIKEPETSLETIAQLAKYEIIIPSVIDQVTELNAAKLLSAVRKRIKEIEIERISIKPRDSLKWESPFNPPPSRISIPFPDVIVHDEGSCSACLSTLLVFLQNYHSALDDHRLQDRKIHIGIGKHIRGCPKGTILIGDCASRMKNEGVFVQGCPPVSSQILRTLGIFFRPPLGGVKS